MSERPKKYHVVGTLLKNILGFICFIDFQLNVGKKAGFIVNTGKEKYIYYLQNYIRQQINAR